MNLGTVSVGELVAACLVYWLAWHLVGRALRSERVKRWRAAFDAHAQSYAQSVGVTAFTLDPQLPPPEPSQRALWAAMPGEQPRLELGVSSSAARAFTSG